MIEIDDGSDMLDVWAVADSIATVAQAVCPQRGVGAQVLWWRHLCA